MTQKQALLMELKHYESNSKFNEDVSKYEQNLDINLDVIPANTRLQINIIANEEKVNIFYFVFDCKITFLLCVNSTCNFKRITWKFRYLPIIIP